MDFDKMMTLMRRVIAAFPVTIKMVLLSLLFSLLIGYVISAMALAKNKPILNGIARFYIAFMRGMPTLVLIFILYFVLPVYLKKAGLNTDGLSKDFFIIATLSLVFSANMSEMMRSAFLSVDKFQWEAGFSVGMTWFTTFRRIIFPQIFTVAIPNLGNNIVNIFKSTSLAFSIGAVDLFGRAKLISANMYGLNRVELYFGTAVIFWVVCVLLERLTKFAEKKFSKGKRVAAEQ